VSHLFVRSQPTQSTLQNRHIKIVTQSSAAQAMTRLWN
jgi:hypothetical protein